MERKLINKRKRVLSLQPSKNPKVVFARRYASNLIPALKKINMDKLSSQINLQSFEQTVKHEVDMALASSAREFAWSHFLQHKLLLSSPHDEGGGGGEEEEEEEIKKILEKSSYKQMEDSGEGGGGEEEIKKRLKELQKLLPGGEEMEIEEMLSEIGSYIVCLELQMTVLKTLVQDNNTS